MQVVTAADTVDQYISEMKREINISKAYERLTRFVLSKIDIMTVTQEEIIEFLDAVRKSESDDSLHKWIGTYNLYVTILKRFFKWLNNPYCMEGISKLKRKEKSVYKPSDLWTQEDDLLFLKYCPSKRDKCYHAISRDSSCRPSELLRLRIKGVVFKNLGGRQYAEILVNGKTGSRHIPLINSLPYLKDWLDDHPARENPNSYLIRSTKTFGKLNSISVNATYARYKEKYFPKLLKERDLNSEDRNAITELLKKPWNPYIRRHSALTDKSKILKEHILRQHAGWTPRSGMPEKYLHYFGNESSESILEAFGIKSKDEEIDKMKPLQCPNCSELNPVNSRFCLKCRMVLTYDAYTEVTQERESYETRLKAMEETQKEILECLKHPNKLVMIGQEE
jgi:integrase/recombinase XerD